MAKILITEDDETIRTALSVILADNGFKTEAAQGCAEALQLFDECDLCLLDLMLRDGSGLDILKEIRRKSSMPVMIISCMDDSSDISRGLDLGADDYVTKPFDTGELLARIAVALRKPKAEQTDTLSACGLTLHCDMLTVRAAQQEVRLTRTECAILKLLMLSEGSPVGRTTILDRISADTPDCTERSLKQHISNIRKKLLSADGKDHIEAVYGIGFKLK